MKKKPVVKPIDPIKPSDPIKEEPKVVAKASPKAKKPKATPKPAVEPKPKHLKKPTAKPDAVKDAKPDVKPATNDAKPADTQEKPLSCFERYVKETLDKKFAEIKARLEETPAQALARVQRGLRAVGFHSISADGLHWQKQSPCSGGVTRLHFRMAQEDWSVNFITNDGILHQDPINLSIETTIAILDMCQALGFIHNC